MRFSSPETFWFLLLIPLLCAQSFAWATLARRKALLRFVRLPLAEKLTRLESTAASFIDVFLGMGTTWALLALCGPQFGAKLEMAQRKGVDVVLVLDVVRSMLAEDLKPSRLARANSRYAS